MVDVVAANATWELVEACVAIFLALLMYRTHGKCLCMFGEALDRRLGHFSLPIDKKIRHMPLECRAIQQHLDVHYLQ